MKECRNVGFGRQVGVKMFDNTENADKGRLKTYPRSFSDDLFAGFGLFRFVFAFQTLHARA